MNSIQAALHILESDAKSTMNEVRKNYRRLVREHHPDTVGANELEEAIEKTQELNWAYSVLVALKLGPEDTFEQAQNSYIANDLQTMFADYVKNYENSFEKDVRILVEEFVKLFFSRNYRWEGVEENFKAYTDRRCFNKAYHYLWDPEFENWIDFGFSIDYAISNLYKKILQDEIGDDAESPTNIDRYSIYYLFFSLFRNSTFCLLQEEYVRPYYCLGKIVQKQGKAPLLDSKGNYSLKVVQTNTLDPKIKKSKKHSLINKKPFKFDRAVIRTRLKYAHLKHRKLNVQRLKTGEEVQFGVMNNHPMYPSTIEAFTMEGKSLGLLSAEFGISMSRLMNNGQIKVSGVVVKDGSPEIYLFITVLYSIEDVLVDNNNAIRFFEENTKRLLRIQKRELFSHLGENYKYEYFKTYMLENYTEELPNKIYDRLLFETEVHYHKGPVLSSRSNSIKDFYFASKEIIQSLCKIVEILYTFPTLYNELYKKTRIHKLMEDKYSIEVRHNKSKQFYKVIIFENKYLLE